MSDQPNLLGILVDLRQWSPPCVEKECVCGGNNLVDLISWLMQSAG